MIRKIALAGAAAALALAGLTAIGIGPAWATPPTITNVTSATVQCADTSTAKLSPSLKNNWVKANHSGDSVAAVKNLPNTKFNTDGNITISANAKSTSCTGSVTGNSVSASVAAVKLALGGGTQAVDNPPLQDDNTCAGLLAGTAPEDVGATYNATVTFKTVPGGNKVAPSTLTGLTITPAGVGFAITGGTISGSLAGGNAKTTAFVGTDTVTAITAAAATSAHPVPTSTACQASLKLKTKKGVTTASLKGPKGLKKIPITDNLANPGEHSTICLRKGTSCP